MHRRVRVPLALQRFMQRMLPYHLPHHLARYLFRAAGTFRAVDTSALRTGGGDGAAVAAARLLPVDLLRLLPTAVPDSLSLDSSLLSSSDSSSPTSIPLPSPAAAAICCFSSVRRHALSRAAATVR